MRTFLFFIIFFLSLFAGSVHGAMYTWTDASGVKHFSNFPPPDAIDSNKMNEVKYTGPEEKTDQDAARKILRTTAKDPGAAKSAKKHKIYDKEFFIGKVQGKTPERVYKFLKRLPDKRDGRKTWVFHDIVTNPVTGQVESVAIKFERGRGKSAAADFVFFINKKS